MAATATNNSQAQQLAQLQQQVRQQNLQYMRYSYKQYALADAQNGTSYQVGGNPLVFLVPIIEGAYAEKLIIRTTLNVNYTPASSGPVASLNAAAPWNVFREVEVVFGNTVIDIHPYVANILSRMMGYLREYPGQALGYEDPTTQSLFYQAPTLNSGNNTWQFDIDVPLNALHPLSVAGLIPIMGTGTRLQVNVTPCTSFTGSDPLLNPVSTNGTIAVSGTVQVIVQYRDYKSFWTRQVLQPNLDPLVVPAIQMIETQQINPLTSGTPMYQRIENPYEFAKMISIVIDGNSSGTFASTSNIQLYELDRAQNTSSVLRKFDATNGGMANYYRLIRGLYGQDLPPGVLVFDAVSENTSDPSLQDGVNYLNLTANGFPAARLGVQVGSVSTANGITPRVQTWGVILNRAGLQVVS